MSAIIGEGSIRRMLWAVTLAGLWACGQGPTKQVPSVDPCAVDNGGCGPHSMCAAQGSTPVCQCEMGFSMVGGECVDVDECQVSNGGCDLHATCTNTEGSFTCTCPEGQLGDGSWCGLPWKTVVVGAWHTCAIRPDKTLWCWGSAGEGVLGNGLTTGSYPNPVQVGTDSDWERLFASAYVTCGQKTDDSYWCWGRGITGTFGNGEKENSAVPVKAAPAYKFSELAVANEHMCGIEDDGDLWCWGNSREGQVGSGTFPAEPDNAWLAEPQAVAGSWKQVSAHGDHTCAIRHDNTLWCWGKNEYGQIGDGSQEAKAAPTQVGTDANWAQVTARLHTSCGLKADGGVWCWGRNAHFDLPLGSEEFESTPKRVWGNTVWKRIHLGAALLCAEKDDGTLWCGGANDYGQLGVGIPDRVSTTPRQVGNVAWREVSLYQYHSCAMRPEGVLMCWGLNQWGALGTGEAGGRNRYSPVAVP